jgi:hypothetical protein
MQKNYTIVRQNLKSIISLSKPLTISCYILYFIKHPPYKFRHSCNEGGDSVLLLKALLMLRRSSYTSSKLIR